MTQDILVAKASHFSASRYLRASEELTDAFAAGANYQIWAGMQGELDPNTGVDLSNNRTNCIISTENVGEIISSNEAFEIVSVEAAAPGKYLDVNLVEIPLELSIGAAYPNPFNPRVKFDYALPSDSHVEILVYNINGQLISELLNSSMQSGKYSIEWNAEKYSSGVYFVNFNINGINSIQRVSLIK